MDTVLIPKRLLRKLLETEKDFEALYAEIEDYLSAHDKTFIAKMREARRAHLHGNIKPLAA